MIYQSPETKFEHYGYISYVIQVDTTNPRQHWQRHIWKAVDPEMDHSEDWIQTPITDKQLFTKRGYTEVK